MCMQGGFKGKRYKERGNNLKIHIGTEGQMEYSRDEVSGKRMYACLGGGERWRGKDETTFRDDTINVSLKDIKKVLVSSLCINHCCWIQMK